MGSENVQENFSWGVLESPGKVLDFFPMKERTLIYCWQPIVLWVISLVWRLVSDNPVILCWHRDQASDSHTNEHPSPARYFPVDDAHGLSRHVISTPPLTSLFSRLKTHLFTSCYA